MDLIPSLMIYDKGDQCRLQVRALGLFVCACVRVCVFESFGWCTAFRAPPLMGTRCYRSSKVDCLWLPYTSGTDWLAGLVGEVTPAEPEQRKEKSSH